MESKIPLPTDNIYKFYALFGLLLLMFSLAATLYTNRISNDRLIGLFTELEELKQKKAPSEPEKLRKIIVERQIEIVKSDREFFRWALAVIEVISVLGIMYGFNKWHIEVQPVNDESARVQLEIMKLQLAKLQAEAKEADS